MDIILQLVNLKLQRAFEQALIKSFDYDTHMVSIKFNYSTPEIKSANTHTMVVDSEGNAHYNDYADKERPPEIYG
jgi:hypothetical protein